MPLKFTAVSEPDAKLVRQIADLTPDNPFYTNEYIEVRKRTGATSCAFLLDDDGKIVAGCIAFLSVGRMNSRVEVTSMPSVPDKELFRRGLFDFCRSRSITGLGVQTFASLETIFEYAERRIAHKRRSEFRLDLTVPDLWKIMNRRHHRLIKKARASGLELRRANDAHARERHVELANSSLERRGMKGESIDSRISIEEVNAFIDCGAGELFQAVHGDEVWSSVLVARSRTGAYAQSSGTSEDGRSVGSSHFLFHEGACVLKAEGVKVLNLGGADEESTGLQDFKLGLGSVKIDLESAEFYTGSTLKKFATRAAALLKSFPGSPVGI